MSEPLTPEEEAAVRAGFIHPGSEALIDRLLATLDAARSTSEGLREALSPEWAAHLRHRSTWWVRCASTHDIAGRHVAEGQEPPLNEHGRVMCRCGSSVLPEHWESHLLRKSEGPHEYAALRSEDEG